MITTNQNMPQGYNECNAREIQRNKIPLWAAVSFQGIFLENLLCVSLFVHCKSVQHGRTRPMPWGYGRHSTPTYIGFKPGDLLVSYPTLHVNCDYELGHTQS